MESQLGHIEPCSGKSWVCAPRWLNTVDSLRGRNRKRFVQLRAQPATLSYLRADSSHYAAPPSLSPLWSEAPLEWERPMPVSTGDYPAGQFCPVILEEVAVGLAFRANSDTPTFLEVLSPVCLREHISNRHDGASIPIRLLAGSELRPRTK